MNLAAAPMKASTVTGPKSAARLYADIEYELAMGDPTPDQEQAGERALHTLEERFPGIKQRADDVVEDGHLPRMSRQAKRRMDTEHEPKPALHARPRDEHQRERRQPNRTVKQRVATATAIHARPAYGTRRSRVSRMGSYAYQTSGAAGGVTSVSQLLMRLAGTVAGLSLLYALVGRNGSIAVSTATSGVTHAIDSLINPAVDPLRPSTSSAAKSAVKGHVKTLQAPSKASIQNNVKTLAAASGHA